MYSSITINETEYLMFDDYVFDEINSQWVSVEDMIEFEKLANERLSELYNDEDDAAMEDYSFGI